MNGFVNDGAGRYSEALWAEYTREAAQLDALTSNITTDAERQRIQGEKRQLLEAYRTRLKDLDKCLF